jgi:hypothetical protein
LVLRTVGTALALALNTVLPPLVGAIKQIMPPLMEAIRELIPPLMQTLRTEMPLLTFALKTFLPLLVDTLKLVLPPLVFVLKAQMAIERFLMGALKHLEGPLTSVANFIGKLITALEHFNPVSAVKSVGGHLLHDITHPFGLHSGGVAHFASGGISGALGGMGGGDSIPAMLEPGEGIVNDRGMRQVGVQGLNALNAGNGTVLSDGQTVVAQINAPIYIDGKKIAKSTFQQMLKYQARTGVLAA